MRTVGIWCEHNFQIYSALPVIKKYLKKNKVILFTEEQNLASLDGLIVDRNFQIQSINKYVFRPAILFKSLFDLFFVPEDFSFVYKNEFVKKESNKKRFIRKVSFLKIPRKRINGSFSRINQFFFRKKTVDNYIPLDLIITFTKVYYSHLIPDKQKVPHINIMESWDHPMKFPYFISPSYCFTWNKDLCQDTKNIQHLCRVRQIAPLKFKYIYDYKNLDSGLLFQKIQSTTYYSELKKLRDKIIILYPTTTSSAGIMHQGEMELIDDLCSSLRGSKYHLYIKPKPNAPTGDYEVFHKYENVIVGMYSDNANGEDMLDDNYHIFRYLLLLKSALVINAGTTFALEAAMMDRKILQLNLSKEEYQGFGSFCKTYHLNKYVLPLNGVVRYDKTCKENLLAEVENCDFTFSKELKNWIKKW